MKNSIMTPMAVAGIAALGIAMAPMAAADSYPTTASFGATQELVDASGAVVTGWTVGELEPSDDVLPGYQPVGTLYEADATVTAVKGTVTPIIANFNARAANGETYRAIFTVPTPVHKQNRPDLSAVMAATRIVAKAIDSERRPTIVYESTVYPGVTENLCGPEIERISGLKRGRDFRLGYSPERINPGDRTHTVDKITKEMPARTTRSSSSSPAFTER